LKQANKYGINVLTKKDSGMIAIIQNNTVLQVIDNDPNDVTQSFLNYQSLSAGFGATVINCGTDLKVGDSIPSVVLPE